jgi:hypothetical protein
MNDEQRGAILSQLVESFLTQWLKELQLIREETALYADKESREILVQLDPDYVEQIHALSPKELRKTIENVALARVVAQEILRSRELLD